MLRRAVSVIVVLTVQEDVGEDVTEGEQALEMVALIDDDEAVHARLADGVEDAVEAVVKEAGVDAREILLRSSVLSSICYQERIARYRACGP